MRPIPASRLGDAHGLLRAIGRRGRLRLDEFVTEYTVDELFPPGLGTRSDGRASSSPSPARPGLLNEDRGTVELTDMGKRYVRAGDAERPYEVAPAPGRVAAAPLRERQMTDSIYRGAAVGLSLYRVGSADFRARRSTSAARSRTSAARAGTATTRRSQGERYTTFLRDLELIDHDRA